jgi:hypothetical protein
VRENIKHKQYKGHDIRSSPLDSLDIRGQTKWKVHLNITFPNADGTGTDTIQEYPYEEPCHATQSEAHAAGFEMGRGIIDERIQTGHISSRLTGGVRRP